MIPIAKPIIEDDEKEAVRQVLDSGMLVQGPIVEAFEKRFATYCGAKYAIALNSGTAALHAALYGLGIKRGDEVITTPFTFVATANAIIMQGATPVFVDIENKTFNIDPSKIVERITKKTKAILPVDLYGHPYNVDKVNDIARKYGLKVIEDACQAVGAEYHGRKTGSLADASAFSFYATKNMITGEGGMVTTNNEECAKRARQFRHHGQSEQYEYVDLGYNYRMTDIAAAIGLAQLKKIDALNKERINNAALLTKGLAGSVTTPLVKEGVTHVFHQYTILSSERDSIAHHLKENGIGCGIYYPKPLHLHPHFKRLGYKEGDFPVAESISTQVLSLPVHAGVTEENIQKIVGLITK